MILHGNHIRGICNLHTVQRNVVLVRHTADLRFAASEQDVDIQLVYSFRTTLQNFQGRIVAAESIHYNLHRDYLLPQSRLLLCFTNFLYMF